MRVAQASQSGEVGRIGIHAEIGLCDHEGMSTAWCPQGDLDGADLEMWDDHDAGPGESGAVDERSMVQGVADDHVLRPGPGGEQPPGGRVPAREHEGCIEPDEGRGSVLEGAVHGAFSCDEAGCARSRLARRRLQSCQRQIIVRRETPAAVRHRRGALTEQLAFTLSGEGLVQERQAGRRALFHVKRLTRWAAQPHWRRAVPWRHRCARARVGEHLASDAPETRAASVRPRHRVPAPSQRGAEPAAGLDHEALPRPASTRRSLPAGAVRREVPS